VFEFLSRIKGGLDLIFKSKAGAFFSAFVFNWYFFIMSSAVLAAYYFFQGLIKSGLLAKIGSHIEFYVNKSVEVARVCSMKLVNLGDFLNCLNNI
jgi:hypothetical protein